MSKRQLFYLTIGILLVGLILFGYGAIITSVALTIVGLVFIVAAIVSMVFWYARLSRG